MAVQQPDVGTADRHAIARDDTLDDGLASQVDILQRRTTDRGTTAHAATPGSSPTATGTPTSDPYSVHEPS